VDLSAPITASDPEASRFERTGIEFVDHAGGAAEIEELFGVAPQLLRNAEGWARETFTYFGTHNSTHVDAPYHYNSVIAGSRAQTVDELPLEWFFAPGVVCDFTFKEDGQAITAAEVERSLAVSNHSLRAGDIVLIHTGRDAYYEEPDYIFRGPGVTAEATRWLYDRGVRVMGIDAWGWDRPLNMQAADALEKQQEGVFWQAHQADLAYSQIERLFNLAALPTTGFTVACFPLRIVGASAAPARVVAILD
jgi:kynurenine formamidase